MDWINAVSGLLGAGLGAIITAAANRAKNKAQAEKIEVDADSVVVDNARKIVREWEQLMEAQEKRAAFYKDQLEMLEKKYRELLTRVNELENQLHREERKRKRVEVENTKLREELNEMRKKYESNA